MKHTNGLAFSDKNGVIHWDTRDNAKAAREAAVFLNTYPGEGGCADCTWYFDSERILDALFVSHDCSDVTCLLCLCVYGAE